jgi:3-oxoacyl-[acyl-carrier protein] reductase
MKSALILGSSKGIGKSIKKKISDLDIKIISPSSKELDTSNLDSVKKFLKSLKSIDYLILNTGGPPAKDFFSITENEWNRYYVQLFLSFVIILQKIKLKKNGFIFLISSHTIKNPEDNLVLSNSFRVAISSVFKTVSKIYSKKNISCINIAPGPIKTKRLKKLVKNINDFEKKLPLGRAGNPNEIGNFVKLIIKSNIKYLNGVIINFDGGLSKNLM